MTDPQPAGTPIVVPCINFDEPTGNPLVEIPKGYGLTSLRTRAREGGNTSALAKLALDTIGALKALGWTPPEDEAP